MSSICTPASRTIARPAALIVALTLLSISPIPAQAHSFVPKELDQLVSEAEQIFTGTVSATLSRRLRSGLIATEVTFSPVRVFKGAAVAEVTLLVAGGEVGGETLRVAGLPELHAGASYLVFVKDNGTSIFPVVGGSQGLFQIERDPVTAEEFVTDARGSAREGEQLRALASPSRSVVGASRIPLDTLVEAITERLRR
jgi:hypothetical protein